MIYHDKRVLITGGTGSLGKTLVRRILTGEFGTPRKVIVMSRDEAKQHQMRVSYLTQKNTTDEVIYDNFRKVLEFRIGDVRSLADVTSAVRDADIVINAAALKQVPVCEYFPWQAVQTNCMGAQNIVQAIRDHSLPVETVVGVSTDKACKPLNVMGMTKALQERIFLSANVLTPKTRFVCVRYGNVMASRGSVIPLFHEQIRNGGPITITDNRMTRFLLTLNDAVDTIAAVMREGKPGETFVPNAPASLMTDVAKALIGKRDIEIVCTGIRPGEKLNEIMVSDEEAPYTAKRGNYYAIRSMLPELFVLGDEPAALKKEFSSGDTLMTLEETVQLLHKNKLLLEDVDPSQEDELLR
nr:polysaccharide biosynthesis protein [uncultured Dethiosulfovibrio sp.]